MSSKNIKIGIDLGTTNSEVSISNNGNFEVIKNIWGDEFTPSVFQIDRALNKIVGKNAYEAISKNPNPNEHKNIKAEVKRIMGTSETVSFERSDKKFSPEQISAEILKSLKQDILRKYPDFDTNSAVITVPAYFSILQSEATKRAGELAGFKHVVLLQEPIAAAISYGFMNSTNETWVVYDLGGGTFDVALVNSKDGLLSVISHNGDNFLGGKDFDAEIVNKIIIPKLKEKFKISKLSYDDPNFIGVFGKLKLLAELAKKELSAAEKSTVDVSGIGTDDEGKIIEMFVDITRSEFEEVISDKVTKTIKLTQDTINSSGIDQSKIKKIVLVGGPTQIPYIRRRLFDEVKIPVDTSMDPLSAVAKGASIYAASQTIPDVVYDEIKPELEKGTHELKLEHQSLSSDNEETVYGELKNLDENKDYFVQIQSESNHFSSPKTKINKCKFIKEVSLEKNKSNLFFIYVFDEDGNIVKISPDSFSITHGISIAGAPISHSIGIVVADRNEAMGEKEYKDTFVVIFEKGSLLPLKNSKTYKTIRKLVKNQLNTLDILIGEGESKIPDRNTFICTLGINGDELPYDLPAGTEIEITIEINESREVSVTAYVPLIDKKYNARSSLLAKEVDIEKIEEELEKEEVRIEDLSKNIPEANSNELKNKLNDTLKTIKAASVGLEEKGKAEKELKELKNAIDQYQEKNEMPTLVTMYNELIEDIKDLIENYAKEENKDSFNKKLDYLETDGNNAIKNTEKRKLNQVIELLDSLKADILFSNDNTWIYQFEKLSNDLAKFTNQGEAQYYIKKGREALIHNDIEELKRCVRNLFNLLDRSENIGFESKGTISGITK
jgi:molecular chaperone DnaK